MPNARDKMATTENPGILKDLTKGVVQVCPEGLQRWPLPDFTALLLDSRDVPELAAGISLCVFPRHAVVHQVGDLFIEVLTDRLRKLIVTTAAR